MRMELKTRGKRTVPPGGFRPHHSVERGDLDLFPKIPKFVIHGHGGHIVGSKRHLLVPADVDDAAFAGDDLVKILAALQGHGDDVIAHARFVLAFQVRRQLARNRN